MAKHPSFECIEDTREATLEALRYVKKAGPVDSMAGICLNVELLIGLARTHSILSVSKGWPHYSGRESYPVPAPPRRDVHDARAFYAGSQREKNGLWRRSQWYGRKRWELLDYLIQQYENILNNEEK